MKSKFSPFSHPTYVVVNPNTTFSSGRRLSLHRSALAALKAKEKLNRKAEDFSHISA